MELLLGGLLGIVVVLLIMNLIRTHPVPTTHQSSGEPPVVVIDRPYYYTSYPYYWNYPAYLGPRWGSYGSGGYSGGISTGGHRGGGGGHGGH
jgi:uncharacterized membrane protein YgcG